MPQVVLDKNHALRTVVNKLNEIDTTYRFFHMELLAGVEDYMCTVSLQQRDDLYSSCFAEHAVSVRRFSQVRECGCTYTFDFSKVRSKASGESTAARHLLTELSLYPQGLLEFAAADRACAVGQAL